MLVAVVPDAVLVAVVPAAVSVAAVPVDDEPRLSPNTKTNPNYQSRLLS